MDATFITDTFEGSALHKHILGTSEFKKLNAHLQGALNAVIYHEKSGNPGQAKFFKEASIFIMDKQLKAWDRPRKETVKL